MGDASVVGPSANPSPTPSFTLADLLTGEFSSTSHAINNLQALAKLGNSLGNQGKIFFFFNTKIIRDSVRVALEMN